MEVLFLALTIHLLGISWLLIKAEMLYIIGVFTLFENSKSSLFLPIQS